MRTPRRFHWLLATALTLIVSVGIGLPIANASEPAQQWTSVQLAGQQSADNLVTATDNSVRVACGNIPLQSVDAAGKLTTMASVAAMPIVSACTGQSAVDKDGVTYSYARDNSDKSYVVAYRGSNRLWAYQAPCMVNALRVGSDGNVYLIASDAGSSGACATAHLIGLKPRLASGQSQPAQLFDTALPAGNVPFGGLSAYSAGLAVQYDGAIQYVSYSGALGQRVSIDMVRDNLSDFQVSSTGMAVVAKRADTLTRNTCHDDNAVSSLDTALPTGKTGWSYALPQCSRVSAIRLTPNGGAVAEVSYPQGGNAVHQLVAVTGSNTSAWTFPLPTTDPADNLVSYGQVSYAVDITGNTLVQRNYTRYSITSGDRWPGVQLVLITKFGIASSPYSFAGDPSDNTDNGRGYLGRNGQPGLAQDIAYVLTQRCNVWGQCSGDESLHAVKVPGLRIDYPRGTLLGVGGPVPPPTQPAVRNYVAMGDSFSSGEGVTPFEAGTDIPKSAGDAYNLCHRSAKAYARLLEADKTLRLSLGQDGFRACSAAISAYLDTPWPKDKETSGSDGRNVNDGKQSKALSSSTNVVTLTIGGNDIGFSRFVALCLFSDCSKRLDEYRGNIAALQLADDYQQILGAASNAKVYVLGYPQLLPQQGCSRSGMTGLDVAAKALVAFLQSQAPDQNVAQAFKRWMYSTQRVEITDAEAKAFVQKPSVKFNNAELRAANSLVTALNNRIRAQVQAAGDKRLVYVDTLSAKTFAGHELCTNQSYFNGLVINPLSAEHDLAYSFHPNTLGQQAYARLLRPYLVPTKS